MDLSIDRIRERDERHTDHGDLLDLDDEDLVARLESDEELQELVQVKHRATALQTTIERVSKSISVNSDVVGMSRPEMVAVDECPRDTFECQCGREYETEEAVDEHLGLMLRLRRLDARWDIGNPVLFWDMSKTMAPADDEEFAVEAVANCQTWLFGNIVSQNIIAQIIDEDGAFETVHDYLDEYQTREVKLPATYAGFDSWSTALDDPADDGRPVVERPDETTEVRLGAPHVEAALRALTGGDEYDAEAYTLSICGDELVVLHGPGGMCFLSPRIGQVSNEKAEATAEA